MGDCSSTGTAQRCWKRVIQACRCPSLSCPLDSFESSFKVQMCLCEICRFVLTKKQTNNFYCRLLKLHSEIVWQWFFAVPVFYVVLGPTSL